MKELSSAFRTDEMYAHFALLLRRLHVFFTAILVYIAIKLTQHCLRFRRRFSNAPSEPVWSRTHRWCARRMLGLATKRRGLWVKCCQYVASRGDVLPDEYVNILGECLDSCPSEAPDTVQNIVRTELASLGHDIDSVIDDFDACTPIASASIAQVHRAKLKEGGIQVILKVQRPGIRPLLLQDLEDLGIVLAKVAGAEPEFDFRPMLQAWLDMVPLETDFVHEGRNSEQISKILTDAKGTKFETEAFVPRYFPEYTTERLLVVEYVDGCSVKESDAMDAAGVDRERFVTEITKAFALQAHVLGMINADAHPGNILVQFHKDGRPGGVPALIDFGITVKLDDQQRLGFCKTIVAAAESNSFMLLQSFEEMGIVFNRVDPQASMDVIKHLFRSTASREETVAQAKEFRKRQKVRDAQNVHSGVASSTRQESLLDNSGVDGIAPTGSPGTPRGRDIRKAEASTEQRNTRRNPIDAFPGFLVFMFRTLGLLRGLSSRLAVTHSYLPIMYEYSSQALADSCPAEDRMKDLVFSNDQENEKPPSLQTRKAIRLHRVVSKVVTELERHGLVIGCQVAAYMGGEIVLDLAAGRMGKHDWRPVTPSTLFNTFSVTKGIMSILFAQVGDENNIEYEDNVSKYWSAYGCNGKESTTVAHILSHQAGLAKAAPEDMSMLRLRDDWQGIIDWLAAEAKPSHPPGTKCMYHYLNFGWLVAGLMQSVTGRTVQDHLRDFSNALGIQDESFIGLPDELCADASNRKVATIHSELFADIEKMLSRRQSKNLSFNGADSSGTAHKQGANIEKIYNEESSVSGGAQFLYRQFFQIDARGNDPYHPEGDPSGGEVSSAEEHMETFFARTPYLIEPQYFSHPVMRAAVIPSANGHFSARALARMYSAVANDGIVDGKAILKKGCASRMMKVLFQSDGTGDGGTTSAHNGEAFGAGVRLYDVVDKRGRVLEKRAMGHAGVGGSMAFCIPEAKFSIAFTCNQLNAFSVAETVLIGAVCTVLGVPTPRAHAETVKRLRRGRRHLEGIAPRLEEEMDLALESMNLTELMTG